MISLLSLMVLAQATEPLRTVFPQQAMVRFPTSSQDWARLPLPDSVLQNIERDLADVRLFDSNGVLVPFVVQRAREQEFEPERFVTLKQISATQKEVPASAGTPNLFEETAVFALPTVRTPTPRLEFFTAASRFVRKATIEALDERGGVVGRLETTLFRLPQAEQLKVWFPALQKSAVTLKVTLVGQDDGFVSLAANVTFAAKPPVETTLEWPITDVPTTEGKETVIRLVKPRGIVPVRLSVKSSTPWFNRQITLRNENDSTLSTGRVFRQAGYQPVERLQLPLEAFSDEHIEVHIENEDSPPLEKLELSFIIEQPELVFWVPQATPVTLLFGGHRTQRAHFDTSGLSVQLTGNREPSTLEAIKPNPDYVPETPLAAFRKPGAEIVSSAFEYSALVEAVNGTDVTRLSFTAEHAQTMSDDFRDLRIVDSKGRQWPYLVRNGSAKLPVPLTKASSTQARHSAWTFRVLGRVTSLTLLPPNDGSFFSRSAQLYFQSEGALRTLVWSGVLTSNPARKGARTELTLDLDGQVRGEGEYTLEFDDSGDAPLSELGMEAWLQVPALTLVLGEGEYRAMWGAPKERAPHYDLERVRDVIEELRTTTRVAGPTQKNPAYVKPSLVEQTGGATRWLFWLVLGIAVVVMAVLTLRIARAEPPDAPPPANPPSAPPPTAGS